MQGQNIIAPAEVNDGARRIFINTKVKNTEDFTEEFLELDGIHQYNDRRSSPKGKE